MSVIKSIGGALISLFDDLTHVHGGRALEEPPIFEVDWEAAKARATDPQTSHDAAAEVDTPKLLAIVVRELQRCPATTSEIAEATGIPRDSLSPRMPALRAFGLVVDSGERRRPRDEDGNEYGRAQIVWRVALAGDDLPNEKRSTRKRLTEAESRIEQTLKFIHGDESPTMCRIRALLRGEA